MSRVTRSATKSSPEAKEENISANHTKSKITTKTSIKKRKSPSSSDDSLPSKSSRSNSLSPITSRFAEKLQVSTPKAKPRSARRALANENDEFRLPGREKEFDELSSYLIDIINTNGSGSMYISGAPGTGKTATLSKIINGKELKSKLKIAFINCTSISSIGAIYKKICVELDLKIQGGSEKDCLATIEHYLKSNHKMTLIILDEVDQLCSSGKQQNVLYHIFEWPSILKSKLILVGIANSLDLTDRLLVRLQTKCELKPKVMQFTAYTKSQIVDIFKSRLEESGVSDLFPPVAIQLLAAKVSSVSGDIRRALNIGKRVVELAEIERRNAKKIDFTKFEALIEAEETSAFPEEPKKEQPIQMKTVVSVLNSVYGNAQKLSDDVDDAFPILQKILICTLLLIIKHDKNKTITVGRLHEVYNKVCKNRNIQAVDQSEFYNLCILAETHGIIRIVTKKEPRFHQVKLQWDEDEVYSALKDKQMITNILNEKSLLGR